MFNHRKFERNISLGKLTSSGCSPGVLKHGAARYVIASVQPREERNALGQSGITRKQLQAQIKSAVSLGGFLGRLAQNARLVAANDVPQQNILLWRKDLGEVATFLESVVPFRPDAKDAALALITHVEQRTGQRHLLEVRKLLSAALASANLPGDLKRGTLAKQIQRGNRERAERMLRGWEQLASAKKLQN